MINEILLLMKVLSINTRKELKLILASTKHRVCSYFLLLSGTQIHWLSHTVKIFRRRRCMWRSIEHNN